MANRYVWSGATGTATGADWANAFLTLAAACTPSAAGDFVLVAHDHSELTAQIILNPGSSTNVNPVKIVCVNRLGSVPPVDADRRMTAQVATSANGTIGFQGSFFVDGVIFTAGNTPAGAAVMWLPYIDGLSLRLDNCQLRLGSTGASKFQIAQSTGTFGTYTEFNNTTLTFSAATQTIDMNSKLVWRNNPATGPAIAGVMPTGLFSIASGNSCQVDLIGLDLSLLGAGSTIVSASAIVSNAAFRFVDCKINPAATKTGVPSTRGGRVTDFIRTGSTGINYATHMQRFAGLLTEEVAVVRAAGGASDGTTPIAWKIVTNANASAYVNPYECPPIAVWNDTVGSPITATVEGMWIGPAPPLEDQCWIDVQYLADAASPLAALINDSKASLLAVAAAQTASSATWNGVAAALTAAYDPATATAAALSGSNLVVTSTGTTSSDQGARGIPTMGQPSGKFYFETTITNLGAGGNVGCGICTTTAVYTSLGSNGAGGAEMFPASGNIWANSGNSGFTLGLRATGDVIGIAVDLDNRKAWFRKVNGTPTNWNGNATHNPATTVGGVTIPAGTILPSCTFGSTGGVAGVAFTSNFGATAFVGAVPAGFTSGFPTNSARPFKLDATFTPQQKGWVYARAKCALAGATFYIDPKVTFGPPTYATLNGTALNATLSNGNLTATSTGGGGGGRSAALKSSGKYYFEVTIGTTVSYSNATGILASSATYADACNGNSGTTVVIHGSGFVYTQGSYASKQLGSAVVATNVIGVAVDLDNKKAWFRKNGGNWFNTAIGSENPATNTGGVTIVAGEYGPAMAFQGTTADNATFNFGTTAFAAAAPSGFSGWWT
jgi:hypothetical protein